MAGPNACKVRDCLKLVPHFVSKCVKGKRGPKSPCTKLTRVIQRTIMRECLSLAALLKNLGLANSGGHFHTSTLTGEIRHN